VFGGASGGSGPDLVRLKIDPDSDSYSFEWVPWTNVRQTFVHPRIAMRKNGHVLGENVMQPPRFPPM